MARSRRDADCHPRQDSLLKRRSSGPQKATSSPPCRCHRRTAITADAPSGCHAERLHVEPDCAQPRLVDGGNVLCGKHSGSSRRPAPCCPWNLAGCWYEPLNDSRHGACGGCALRVDRLAARRSCSTTSCRRLGGTRCADSLVPVSSGRCPRWVAHLGGGISRDRRWRGCCAGRRMDSCKTSLAG